MPEATVVGHSIAEMPLTAAPTIGSSTSSRRDQAYHRYDEMLRHSEKLVMPKKTHTQDGHPGARTHSPSYMKRLVGNAIIAPFFLFSSLLVILCVPEKLVKKITAPFSGLNWWEQFGKRSFDFSMAVLGFIMSSILFFIVPLLIRLDSRGGIFYGQQRVGVNLRRRERRQVAIAVNNDRRTGERRVTNLFGRPFTVYKFRTMRHDAEKQSGAVWAQKNDPRITRVGRILRFTHVDEIPQFLNVLLGDMSMVGPRPERPQIIPKLVTQVPNYAERLEVKPGMTGNAQIYCGYDETIDDVREKVRFDLMYVKNHNLKQDILLLWKTLWMIMRGKEEAD